MAVEAYHLYIGASSRGFYEGVRLSRVDWNAKLRIHLARVYRFKRMRIKATCKPQKSLLNDAVLTRDTRERLKLVHVVDNKVSDAVLNTVLDVPIGLVCTVEEHLLRRETRCKRRIYLARRYDVTAEALRFDDRIYALEAKRLACEERRGISAEVLVHLGDVSPASLSDHVLIENVQRSAVFFREFDSVDTANSKVSCVIDI